ncbi:MAG: bile acid:sodium symporter family protein [Abditibacteriota bacterium]|nr:bile acid:sodium symporter family protein [Abditibacteriota bacterium]
MAFFEKISGFCGKYMALIVFVLAALALFVPNTCLWVQMGWISYLLMLVMFGMGLTLKPVDFKPLVTRPRDILIGCAAQFALMPLIAFGLVKIFNLEPALAAGVILVGTCPGGTASNVITYLAGGDVALSVGMTSINTLLAPVLTPSITYLLLKSTVDVDAKAMFISIVEVVILPIALGFVINRLMPKTSEKCAKVLPFVSVVAICLIVMSVVSHSAERILTTGGVIVAVVILHNLLGYLCGYGVAKALRLDIAKAKALSVEIGMQNSGLATSLAATAFPALAAATVPGALFSVWHNISGAILANILRGKEEGKEDGE